MQSKWLSKVREPKLSEPALINGPGPDDYVSFFSREKHFPTTCSRPERQTPNASGWQVGGGRTKERDGNAMVFVVDDDLSMRRSIENLIRSVGLQVKAFASAEAFLQTVGRGLRRAQSSRLRRTESSRSCPAADAPGCAVLDVRLPGISGLELQRRMAEFGIELPIIFVSGHGDIPMSVRAIKAGAMEFLTKPFSDQDLIEAVQRGIERDRRERRPKPGCTQAGELSHSAVQEELDRLAGEIHDGLAQHLSAISMQLAVAKEALSSTGGAPPCNLDQAIELANLGLVEARRCARNLRSNVVDEFALRVELQRLAARWSVAGWCRCNFESDNIPEDKLSSGAKHELLRIAQEAIHNAIRHATPTLVVMTLRWHAPDLVLQVKDDGTGISADRFENCEGFGLRNMRRRAREIDARFEIQTAAGHGTSIIVTVPIS